MDNNNGSYHFSNLFNLLKNITVFSLVVFVLLKPICKVIFDDQVDQKEISLVDSDENEEDTEKEASEEDSLEENIAILSAEDTFYQKKSEIINFTHTHTNEYKVGIVLPPPEFV